MSFLDRKKDKELEKLKLIFRKKLSEFSKKDVQQSYKQDFENRNSLQYEEPKFTRDIPEQVKQPSILDRLKEKATEHVQQLPITKAIKEKDISILKEYGKRPNQDEVNDLKKRIVSTSGKEKRKLEQEYLEKSGLMDMTMGATSNLSVGSKALKTILKNARGKVAVKDGGDNVIERITEITNEIGPINTRKSFERAFDKKARETGNGDLIQLMKGQYVKVYDEVLETNLKSLLRNESGFSKIPTKDELVSTSQNFRTQMIDRFAPISDLTRKTKLLGSQDPYVAARNFAGHYGRIQSRLDDFSDILRPAKNDLSAVKEYAKLERFQELADRGITKFEGGATAEQIAKKKFKMEQELGERLPQIKAVGDQLRAYSDNLLQETRKAGIISEEAYQAIKAKNQKYLPLQRLEYLADQADNLPRGKKTFSVASQDIIKGIKGSEKEIADPIESMVRNTYKTINLIERNKVAQRVGALSKKKRFDGTVIKVNKNTVIPQGMDKISSLENGVKVEYAVPREVADAMKGMTSESIDFITKAASLSSKALRTGATSLNLAFVIPNAVRDFQTAMVASKYGFNPLDWARGLAEAVKRGDDYKKFLDSGGSFSGFFQQGKNLPKTVKELTRSKGSKIARTVVNPIKLIEAVGETIELTPRLGVFKKALRKGVTPEDAAFNARNATVDFAKSGSKLKVANMWVPFLNARLQGTLNIFKAFKDRPLKSSMIASTIVGMPAIATYYHNTRNYPEIWNDIAQFEKDNYFILIYGDAKDDNGKYSQIAKIPKGDIGKMFGNPLENFMSYLDGGDTKAVDELAIQVMSDISPISFERDGKFSLSQLASGTLPPTVKGGLEGMTNKNFFTERDIVPQSLQGIDPKEQYKEDTPAIAKFIGEKTGTSPLKVENFVGTQFAGVGRQLMEPSKAHTQLTKRFSGAYGRQQEQGDIEELKGLEKAEKTEAVKKKREAEKFWKELKGLSKEEKKNRLKDKDENFLKQLKRIAENEKLSYKDKLIKGLGVQNGERAKYIVKKMKGMSKQEKKAYLKDLSEKNLISDTVLEQIGVIYKGSQ